MSDDPTQPQPRAPIDRSDRNSEALPQGTRFGEFELQQVLGVGGFGIVYLAHDHSLQRAVAIKEYMPSSLALRGDGAAVTLRSLADADTYAAGLKSFVNEARLLARFDHPSLLKVYRFWESNGTAYMVMPYLQGKTLRDTRRAMAEVPSYAWMRGVLDAMLDALEQIHREEVFHRDIAPDNILLPREGAPILLDFGAARRVISDRTQAVTAILKPSYAPIEQYAEMTTMRQGPWTDFYALGAVMHFLLYGAPPPPSTARAVQPDAELPEQSVPGVSPRFLAIVSWMLRVRPHERPQSVADLRAVLQGQAEIPAIGESPPHARSTTVRGNAAPAVDLEPTVAVADLDPTQRYVAPAPGTAGPPPSLNATLPSPGQPRGAAATRRDPPSPPPPLMADVAPARRGAALWIAIAGAGVLAAGSAWWLINALPRSAAPVLPTPTPPASAVGYSGPRLGEVASVPTWGRLGSAPAGGGTTKPAPTGR